ncbi:cold shock domain-containing protein [Solitalea sp. MAHUQ-68]|uniref:Cold shock domain-containing protein n=1 Tax=Solitalea agri TaxID=2953739 RepID=A0A9X2EZX7_9SPHI|nr:cold shock domain-containing protein [Solitalea agri]MCO4292047.1 cold shock domain-containing protein [Solitalea agri]
MGKSSETFSKKENQKKRLKKQKDKELKKEERKANSSKGKGLEDMMAYVDEHGNITSTPPDPTKKVKINSEDIQIAVARTENIDESQEIRKGTVTFFNTSKGFGFIRDHESQESIFVHINSVINPIKENDRVTFKTEKGPKGLSAIEVQVATK